VGLSAENGFRLPVSGSMSTFVLEEKRRYQPTM